MPHRRVQDESGRWWDVWDTRPTIIDRRAGRERRTGGRSAADRRQKSEPRVSVEPEFRKGWLAFQSGVEWRRFAPIPDAWESMSDGELLALLGRAAPTESPSPNDARRA
jgi:hypothetical protein